MLNVDDDDDIFVFRSMLSDAHFAINLDPADLYPAVFNCY